MRIPAPTTSHFVGHCHLSNLKHPANEYRCPRYQGLSYRQTTAARSQSYDLVVTGLSRIPAIERSSVELQRVRNSTCRARYSLARPFSSPDAIPAFQVIGS